MDSVLCEPLLNDSWTDAGIDQDSPMGIPQKIAVAATAATQAEKRELF